MDFRDLRVSWPEVTSVELNNKISVIIPTKDEEETIREVIRGVKPYARDIIIVDGHSKDSTREIAQQEKVKVILDNGKGKGDALKIGIKEAAEEVLVFIDSDGSHEASDIPFLTAPIFRGKADLVIGSRIRGGSDELHGNISKFVRGVGSGIITLIINWRWKAMLTDCENGFRAIDRKKCLSLDLRANDFNIEQEMVMKCLSKQYIVTEVPSHEYERKGGQLKLIVWKKWYKFLWTLIRWMF